MLDIQSRSRVETWEDGMWSPIARCLGNEPRQPGAASKREVREGERKINRFQKAMQTLLVQDATFFPPRTDPSPTESDLQALMEHLLVTSSALGAEDVSLSLLWDPLPGRGEGTGTGHETPCGACSA